MNKKLIFFVVLIIVLIYFLFQFFSDTSDISKNMNSKKIESSNALRYADLYFYDNKTNCSLNGQVIINNKSLGNTTQGHFAINSETRGGSVILQGLTDSCFGKDNNLPFFENWEISDFDYYFENNETAYFITSLTPRTPRYYQEMVGFVRPNEVAAEISSFKIDNDSSEKLQVDSIHDHFFLSYMNDYDKFRQLEYWQTPKNSIKNKAGDCEDWAIYFDSLIRAYNPEANCYVALWDTHSNVICRFNRSFVAYDQAKIKKTFQLLSNPENDSTILQDNKINTRSWLSNYFSSYGLSASEREIYALFNDKELITFENREDFVSWVVSFSN